MRVKIAAFGKQEFIDRLKLCTTERNEVEIIPFPYTRATETTKLIEKAILCDIYLFPGTLPFLYVKDKVDKKRLPAILVEEDEYMIATSLFHVMNNHNQPPHHFSMDACGNEHMDNVMAELRINEPAIYTYPYGNQMQLDIAAITMYHEQLWNAGKISYVLTSVDEVGQQLQAKGIPVYNMRIPKKNMEQAIEKAFETATMQQSNRTQIVAGFIQIKQEKDHFDQEELQHKLEEILVKLGKKTRSSIQRNADKLFTIVGTTLLLNYLTSHYRDFPLLEEITQSLQTPVYIGFGLGLNARQAEDNAKSALNICQQTQDGNCYIVNERSETIGPLGIEKHFDTSRLYRALIHKARLNNELSYNFIDFIKLRNNEPFSAHDIAAYYKVTKRSAERTIYKLLSGDVIKVVGEEKPYQKGRPRKLFQITI